MFLTILNMGYMGFGMRKEVYSRKAKNAFTKLKEMYGDDKVSNNSKIQIEQSGSISYEKHSYKPFFQTRIYKVLKFSFIILLMSSFIWGTFLQKRYHNYQKGKFESGGFKDYYEEEMNYLRPILESVYYKVTE